jgi:hypothetical protein
VGQPTIDRADPTLVVVLQGKHITQIAAGGEHSLAVEDGAFLIEWAREYESECKQSREREGEREESERAGESVTKRDRERDM